MIEQSKTLKAQDGMDKAELRRDPNGMTIVRVMTVRGDVLVFKFKETSE